MLDRLFKLQEKGTTIRVEVMAGLATFMTMAYIIFVNPTILSVDYVGNSTGLSVDAALLATCLAAFVASVFMGLYANFPIVQAPGMGENFFFVTVIMALTARGVTNSWQVALGIVFISGIIFLILSIFRVREAIIDAVSPSLKNGIAAGIGLLIAFIGLKGSGVIETTEAAIKLTGDVMQPGVLIFFAGLFLTAVLHVRGVRGAILWGILFNTLLAVALGEVRYEGIVGLPQDHAFFKFDLGTALSFRFLPFVIVFLFMDMFDTVGTLIGVSEQAGLMQDNRLPGANRALLSDAVGTVVGACSGTSTVTSFVESSVGVEYGGRTGLVSVTAGLLFLVALFFTPLVGMVGKHPAITAPALVIVGAMMARNVRKIVWEDFSEAVPAFLVMLGIPLTFSVADGLAMGFVAYPVIKLCSGRRRDVSWLMIVVAVFFVLRYTLISI